MSHSWPLVAVEELAARHPNALSTGPFGSSIGARHFRSHGVPVLRGSNLSIDVGRRLIDDDLVFLDPEMAGSFARSSAVTGDLVFTCWGTIGQVGLVDHRSRYRRYIVSNKQMKLTPDPKRADSLFLYYAFSGPELRAAVASQAIGSSVPGFNLGQLRRLRIGLPPLAEQRAIAAVLGALDDKIALNHRMNETLEAMAKALFKSWFSDFDPVRARAAGKRPSGMDDATAALFPAALQPSALGPLPRGWGAAPLAELAEINPRRRVPRGVPAPYVHMKALPTSGPRIDAFEPRPPRSGSRFQNGDVLLARITPCLQNGKTALVDLLPDGVVGWGSTEFIVLSARAPCSPEQLYLILRSEPFRAHATRSMVGSTGRQRVPVEAISSYRVARPPAPVAAAFAQRTGPLFTLITHNHDASKALAALRDALLPRLLSGELRLRSGSTKGRSKRPVAHRSGHFSPQ